MTDQDLRAQLAAMQASLRHIEASFDRAESDRGRLIGKIDTVTERVVALEAGMPSRKTVEASHVHDRVEDARRFEKERIGDNLRATAPTIVSILALIVAALSLAQGINTGGA